MDVIPMNRIKTLFIVLAAIAFASIPLLVQASQITPNPNPAGSTLDIINDPFAVNTANPFVNAGTLNIDALSTLTNSVGAALTNSRDTGGEGTLNNAGTLINYGGLTNTNGATLTNAVGATLNNYGILSTNTSAPFVNAGTLNNFAGGFVDTAFHSTLSNTGALNNFTGGTFRFAD